MTDLEDRVSDHYTTSDLLARIETAVASTGLSIGGSPDTLKPVDEFHSGGTEATEHLLSHLDIGPETRVLDIGSGIGGTARLVASRHDARVIGVDLTPAFVETATRLSDMVGLSTMTEFRQGSALELPVASGSIDIATMLHVGMNIADKEKLFAEAARVLTPGGHFAVFDIMRVGAGGLTYPFPWAEAEGFSFVEEASVYEAAAARAGFDPVAQSNRADATQAFFSSIDEAIGIVGHAPPLGIHLLMGDTAGDKIRNYRTALDAGLLAPVEMIFSRRGTQP